MNAPEYLTYFDHDNVKREVQGCKLSTDKQGRHWVWCKQLEHNLAYKIQGRENALLAAIDSLLFTIELRDERIAGLQRIANLAQAFADEIKPDEEEQW
jgi:hypothetical protein